MTSINDARGAPELDKRISLSRIGVPIGELRELLAYDAQTGLLTWRTTGEPAGFKSRGYVIVLIERIAHCGHRLAWALHYGEHPPLQVDHINGDRADNRICNLRLATNAQNQCNSRLSPRNKSGFKGVSFSTRRQSWRACISIDGKRRDIGSFATPEAAYEAYCAAAFVVYGEFARPERAGSPGGWGGVSG